MTPAELKSRRETLLLSQRQLAALLDTSENNIQNWEQGRTEMPGFLHLALHALEHNPPAGHHLPPLSSRRGGRPGRPPLPQ